jgi:serine/threonine protein kinase/Tol biopolymer transport system component
MIGQTLAHYEILEPLGEGGMGVVYKARDTRLDRLVAIKVLPADRVADDKSKRRFMQEAKAASALNHPNIVTIYGIDHARDVDFIAMEYMAGRPLSHLIPLEGLPLRAVLRYAIQIADALVAAHAAGIVHRDLKPGNVIVTESGAVKVLDFGLAKLVEPVSLDGSGSGSTMMGSSGTHTGAGVPHPLTATGMIMGTLAYMSPEQAEGKPVDSRSDIFSFGAMLYEMVTGRKAFAGASAVSAITAILRDEPPSASTIVNGLPSELERIIVRCLRKDPSRRYQHIDDVKVALEELKDESESGMLRTAAAPDLPQTKPRAHRRSIWLAAGVALIMIAALAAAWLLRRAPAPASDPELTTASLTTDPGIEDFPTFSPNGGQVAYMWNGPSQDNFDIYVRVVGGGAPLRLTSDPAVDSSPAWSPDGRTIAFLRDLAGGRFAVMLVAPIGGPERKLAEVSSRFAALGPVSWAPDSRTLAVPDQDATQKPDGIFLISTETGNKRRLTTPAQGSAHDYYPALSPDGRRLAFVRTKQTGADLLVVPMSEALTVEGDPKVLMSHRYLFFGLAWTLDGLEVVAVPGIGTRSGELWRMAADGSSRPRRVPYTGDEVANPIVSRQGNRLVYSQGVFEDRNIWRLPLTAHGEAAGAPARFVSSTRHDASAAYSPDGKRIAFHSTRSGRDEIWVAAADGTRAVQLTSLSGPRCGSPRWSPDSSAIAFEANPDGNWDVFVIPAAGGKARRLTTQPTQEAVPGWSHDGRSIYFWSDRTGSPQIWKMPSGGGDAVQVTRRGGFEALESSDGTVLYYTKTDDGREGLWSMPVSGGEEVQVVDAVIAARAFAIVPDGIYFIRGVASDGNYFVPRTVSDTIEFYSLRTRQRRPVAEVQNPWLYLSVSPDGAFLLYSQNDQANNDLKLVDQFR